MYLIQDSRLGIFGTIIYCDSPERAALEYSKNHPDINRVLVVPVIRTSQNDFKFDYDNSRRLDIRHTTTINTVEVK